MFKDNYDSILKSNSFKNKKIAKSLFIFLYQKTIEGKKITENIIAEEFFKRSDFISSDDTIVRVNIFKLRKLLKAYYEAEGINDSHKISIPKGTYALSFTEATSKVYKKKNSSSRFRVLYLVIAFLILGWLSTLFYFFNYSGAKEKNHPLWKQFNDNLGVEIVLVNPYFMLGYDREVDRSFVFRDWFVNKKEDKLPDFYKESFDKKIEYSKLKFPMFGPTNVYCLPKLYESLIKENISNIGIQPFDNYIPKEVLKEETVFMGSLKNLVNMEPFLESTSFRIIENGSRRVIKVKDSTEYRFVKNSPNGGYVDYGMLISKKGTFDNNTLLISATIDRGVTGVLDKVNSQEFIDEIEAKYGYFPEQFEMIVKVEGYKFANNKEEVVYFNELKN